MAKVKPDCDIWGLEFNQYVCYSFHGNRTIFDWDIANFMFDLENWRSRSWPRSNPMSHLIPRVQSICLFFVSWQSDHFWLRYSKFHIWPWKNLGQGHDENRPKSIHVIYRSGPTIVLKMKEIQKVVQKLSREQESAAGGGGVRTGTKT